MEIESQYKGEMSPDKIQVLNSIGLRPFFVRHLCQSFSMSHYKPVGLKVKLGHFDVMLGPQTEKTGVIGGFAPPLISQLGINPFAFKEVANDFANSKVKAGGVMIHDYGVVLRMGPQGNETLVISEFSLGNLS